MNGNINEFESTVKPRQEDEIHGSSMVNKILGSSTAVLWIRIGFNADPDPAVTLNADPDRGSQTNADPVPGQTLKSKTVEFQN